MLVLSGKGFSIALWTRGISYSSFFLTSRNAGKVGRPGPSTDAERNFQVSICLLQKSQPFKITVQVFSCVVPRVVFVVLVGVSPEVTEEYAAVRVKVGKGVEDVGEVLDGQVKDVVVAGVDGPGDKVGADDKGTRVVVGQDGLRVVTACLSNAVHGFCEGVMNVRSFFRKWFPNQ